MMRMRAVAVACGLAALLSCITMIAIGCARLRRVSTGEVVTAMPTASIVPPIATVAPPVSVVEAPPTETPEVEAPREEPTKPVVPEVKVAAQTGLRDELEGLHSLLSELQKAVSTPSPEKVETLSLRVLVRLAHIEFKALEHLRKSEEAVRVSEVVQMMDEMRANLRDARSAIKRGSVKVASAAISEMIDKAKALEELLISPAHEKESASQTTLKQPYEKP